MIAPGPADAIILERVTVDTAAAKSLVAVGN
jgi:hypothetical protein